MDTITQELNDSLNLCVQFLDFDYFSKIKDDAEIRSLIEETVITVIDDKLGYGEYEVEGTKAYTFYTQICPEIIDHAFSMALKRKKQVLEEEQQV